MTARSSVTAAEIRAELVGASAASSRAPHATECANPNIVGALDLSGLTLDCPIAFVNCYFDDEVIAREASLESIMFSACQLKGLDCHGLSLKSDFQLCTGSEAARKVQLDHARIGGNLSCN